MKSNYEEVKEKMYEACMKSGRALEEVTLIAVSKTQPIERVIEAYELGMVNFGENKPQEIRDKSKILNHGVSWHMIGNLQSNKIKYVIETCELIHSVDSLNLAIRLNEEAMRRNLRVKVLLQVNISKEQSKNGFEVEELYECLSELSKLRSIQVTGLMTIAPYVDDPEKNRTHFRNLHEVFIDIKGKNIDNITMNALSMGMTGDYQVAIEEGATHIRVGTGIFGIRN